MTQVAPANPSVYRGYHSAALLLPDGRVLVTGGDHDYGGAIPGSNKNAEIYSPAYLFKGPRPVVTAAPATAKLGTTMFVQTPDGASISDALMIVPGSVTHAQDWTQRANQLDFTTVAGGINITLPANPNEAPPGYYMLFLVNNAGVPSIAKFFRADLPTVLAGDYNGNDVVDAADYIVWRNSAGQSGTGLAADGDGDGTVDADDYGVWRSHFGQSGAAGSTSAADGVVPEPVTLWMVVVAAVGLLRRRDQRRRGGYGCAVEALSARPFTVVYALTV